MNRVWSRVWPIAALFTGLANSVLAAGSDIVREPASGPYSVGFTHTISYDTSRQVNGSGASRPRPVPVYTWYPAVPGDGSVPLTFGRYAQAWNEDINTLNPGNGVSAHLQFKSRALARSLSTDVYQELLASPMTAIENAPSKEAAFPLIVFAQGLYYESPAAFAALAEHLVSTGFVVATTPLVGTLSPVARMDVRGLETQVRDLEYVIGQAREKAFVSQEGLGVFGFDMGGMAALILAMRNRDVDALVTVSSGILYDNPEGIPQNMPDFDPGSLTAAWLHSVPGYWIRNDTPSLFDRAIHSHRSLLLTSNMGHVDYTGYALIPGRKQMNGYWGDATSAVATAYLRIQSYVGHFFNAQLHNDPDSARFIAADPESLFPGAGLALQRHSPQPVPMSYDELVVQVLTGNAVHAVEGLRALSVAHPDHAMLREASLERLVWSLRDTWGMTEKIMPVIRFRAELYPGSPGALHMLAEGYRAVSDLEAAARTYRQILAINPEDRNARVQLERLEES